jgi:hypothetical protein
MQVGVVRPPKMSKTLLIAWLPSFTSVPTCKQDIPDLQAGYTYNMVKDRLWHSTYVWADIYTLMCSLIWTKGMRVVGLGHDRVICTWRRTMIIIKQVGARGSMSACLVARPRVHRIGAHTPCLRRCILPVSALKADSNIIMQKAHR